MNLIMVSLLTQTTIGTTLKNVLSTAIPLIAIPVKRQWNQSAVTTCKNVVVKELAWQEGWIALPVLLEMMGLTILILPLFLRRNQNQNQNQRRKTLNDNLTPIQSMRGGQISS